MTAPVLWSPPLDGSSRMEDFMRWLAEESAADVTDYDSLWQWSVDEPDAFWSALWRYFDVPSDGDPTLALAHDAMPGAVWFPHVRVNYAETMLRLPGRADDDIVVFGRSQSREDVALTAAELRDQVARARAGLVRAGVSEGDRVAAYAPNVPETLILMLASASLGAVFTSCAPEFGTQSVVDRWQQIEPTLLLVVDGYRYGTKPIDRHSEVEAIRAALPSVRTTVWLPYLDADASAPDGAVTWADFTAKSAQLEFSRLPFAAPLYILFSSGTTGLPKPIVHGHGGITIEHLKALALHCDLGPGDRFFWFSTTGWMMWNFLVSGLATGSAIVMVDGDPASPDLGALWRMAGELGVTYFGTSAPFLLQCRKADIHPRQLADLSALRAIGSTGAPLPAEGFWWAAEEFGPAVQMCSVSGGTDVCAAFVGSAPIVPVYAGEISCRCLGCAVDSVDPEGRPVRDQLGELVVTRPMPSMPVGFWGDPDGSRYRAAYFEDIPGMWRHGDWIRITDYGSCVITGRSDATLNRGGVRLGTSEFYSVVESLPEVADSLVVHLEDDEGGAGRLLLFVATADGAELDDDLCQRIRGELRSRLSPRHVPDEIHQVRGAPRTLSGKKLEVPVKKILRGTPIDDAAARGALQNPEVLEDYTAYGS
ncbi:acetoacetate--CoA ligase [Aeromicrobium camelliae]|uniref:Acetoacetate--CoA ligase n=1 Tax=Aeromicrobium camelliae TaxID=1538144 RepID=A0A3N6WN54_9ACTN|nr:acetoacetate--CoA ligase [Aeromicrobium camelliae]RQN08899.1 acetoacetate--CoA ligase [Aeromicrobium camelliae]